MIIRFICLFFCSFFSGFLQAEPVEIVFWHSFAGHLGAEVQALAQEFNQQQNRYLLKLVYKGEYTETLTSFAAAFRAKKPPALVQIFEVGRASVLYPKGIIKPVSELMNEQGYYLPEKDFLPAIRDFYSQNGALMAMPFNSSIPVLYYNKAALAKVGYTKRGFPKTWEEMESLAYQLKQAGYSCIYTTAYPSWIQVESFSALHGLPMTDAENHPNYNNKFIIRHLERLKNWQQKDYFEYGGRASNANNLFISGRCPLFSQSSGSYNSLAALAPFPLGVATLPLDSTVTQTRRNNVIGGAALWVVTGQTEQVYQGIAEFFVFLAKPETQIRWQRRTGYLPLGMQGSYSTLAKSKHPILVLAQFDLSKSNQVNSQILGPQNLIRTINDEALEAIFSGIKTPKQAMDEAVARADYALLRFARNSQ